MEENTEIEFEGKRFVWDGEGWYEARTYMVPPDNVVARLNAQFRATELKAVDIVNPKARAPRRGWSSGAASRAASTGGRARGASRGAAEPQEPPAGPVEKITAFEGDNAFLSNDAPATVHIDGQSYPSVTAAFDALHEHHQRLRPGQQREWDEKKRVPLMKRLLRSKFAAPAMRAALLATADKHLSHQSEGADRFWHLPGGEGENRLGRLLMDLRAQMLKHYCLLSDDQIVEHLREYLPENPVVPDEALARDCCWKRVTELVDLYKDELGPGLLEILKQRKSQLAPPA